MPNQQLGLPLPTPAEHGDLLHSGQRHGAVLIWQQRAAKRKWTKVTPSQDLAKAMGIHAGQTDRFVSVNEFDGWRLVKLLRSLRTLYVDLDNQRDIYLVLDALLGAGIPDPTFIVESGRGLHLYWLLEPLPAQALPVWQAVQDRLIEALAPLGADPMARDCTRVLRIVGSINSKTGDTVAGYMVSNQVWTLRRFADEVLVQPQKAERAKVSSLQAARAKRVASVAQRSGRYRLWYHRYRDLCLIADHHAFMRAGGLPEGCRDTLLFTLSVALSWFAAPDVLRDEISQIAQTYTPSFTEREVAEYTRQVVIRAEEAHAGGMREWEGQKVDPRYRYTTATLRRTLGDLITPELEPQLIALGTPKTDEEKAGAERERLAQRDRVDEGRYTQTREQYRAQAKDRASQARTLQAEGVPTRQIASMLSASIRSVQLWCAKSAPLV